MRTRTEDSSLVWYAAYGTNLRRERFRCYLEGGRPVGALREYPGCRDRRPPLAEMPLSFHGRLAFGGESSAWTGAMAFADDAGGGRVWARAYLVTVQQLADVIAQEIRLAPGAELTAEVVGQGGRHGLGPGRYDQLLALGRCQGQPVVALTASRPPAPAPPAQAYLWSMAAGLRETHGLSAPEIAAYLATAVGVQPTWSAAQLLAIAATSSRAIPARTAAATRAVR